MLFEEDYVSDTIHWQSKETWIKEDKEKERGREEKKDQNRKKNLRNFYHRKKRDIGHEIVLK